mmetsp:Transcript_29632/g.40720  ORF Transcript_29632/g.40720 Transcript_29632/m.40720 type:complete len:718 (+) Transcript_29632:103-2256(+)
MVASDTLLDWTLPAHQVAGIIQCRDGAPGVLDPNFHGQSLYLYDAHPVDVLPMELRNKAPKSLLARRDGAVLVACGENTAVWIGHMKKAVSGAEKKAGCTLSTPTAPSQPYFKLWSTQILPSSQLDALNEWTTNKSFKLNTISPEGREVYYTVTDHVAKLYFEFYNGAMSTRQCEQVTAAYKEIKTLPAVKIIMLMGGYNFFSNGIHLNQIEHSVDKEAESMKNILAIDDIVESILKSPDHVTVSVMRGNAGAGGVMLANAADYVVAHENVVMNPHYRGMGLFGSEYWTFTLPRSVGAQKAHEITESCLPIGAHEGERIGLLEKVWGRTPEEVEKIATQAVLGICPEDIQTLIDWKHHHVVPAYSQMDECRRFELSQMKLNFADPAYERARENFVYKVAPKVTPFQLMRLGKTGTLLDATATAKVIENDICKELKALSQSADSDVAPGLAYVLVSECPDSMMNVAKKAEACGFHVKNFQLKAIEDQEALEADLISIVHSLNEDNSIDGILVKLPIPGLCAASTDRVLHSIAHHKDVDGLRWSDHRALHGNCAQILKHLPATVSGILHLLAWYDVKLAGKVVVVVDNSDNIVGNPLSNALSKAGATVMMTHIQTKDLDSYVRQADILIASARCPNLIQAEWVRRGAVVIDAGVSQVNGKLVGDVEAEHIKVREVAAAITTIGGVGPMTISMVLKQTMESFRRRHTLKLETQAVIQKVA